MFPYSDKTQLLNNKDVYTVTLDFDTTTDSEYNGFKFTVAEVEKVFEKLKFKTVQTPVYYSPDLLTTEFGLADTYGIIEGVYFHKDVIKVEIKIIDTEPGKLIQTFMECGIMNKDTKFFVNVIHKEGAGMEFQNLYPSFKKYSHETRMGHFEGEIRD